MSVGVSQQIFSNPYLYTAEPDKGLIAWEMYSPWDCSGKSNFLPHNGALTKTPPA